MMSSLLPYSSYKKSDVPWLEEIPEHWFNQKLWTISRVCKEKNPGDLPLLSVFLHKGVIFHHGSKGQTHAPSLDLSNYQVVRRGNFVLNNQQAWRGSVGVSSYDGIISPAYVVLRLSSVIDFQFADYLFQNRIMVDQYVTSSRGVGDIQRQVYWQYLRNIQTPLPPIDEQQAIVKYLAYVDKRVKKYIRAKQKQIKLLEEMKQAFIHQAVTRGLDPIVPLKPSGFEGLGDVPEHWCVVPMKGILKKRKEVVGALSSDLLLLSLTTNGVIPRDIENPTGKYPADFDSYQLVHPGDLIFCLFDIDETPRTIGISRLTGMITGAYSVFSCENGTMANFIYYNFLDKDFRKELKPYYSGLRKVIQKERFLRIKIALPPIRELENICDFLDKKILQINNLVTKYREQIALVTLNQTRLIADVVTGKLDVREAASQLPDELEGLLEEPDETLEEDLENREEMEEAVPEEE